MGLKVMEEHFRIINDVIQYFVLHRWVPFGRSCTIDFNIYPLCLGVDKNDFSSGSYDIVRLLGTTNWWEYDPKNEESVLETIDKMLIATKDQLIPFFEQATDSASAYEAKCNLERRIYTGIPGGIIMNDTAKKCFAIKMGAYSKAIEHLRTAEMEYIRNQNLSIPNESEEKIKRRSERIEAIRKEIELISIPDMDYINTFIAKNEKYSLDNLSQSRKKRQSKLSD